MTYHANEKKTEDKVEPKAEETKVEAVEKPKAAKVEKVKTFPVKLLKNYRPVGEFQVSEADGYRDPTEEERAKVPAGTSILITVQEATTVINKKIAERNDPIG